MSILNQANDLGCNLVSFSSGGKIEKFCESNNIEYRKIKQFISPRASTVSFVYSMLNILELILPINKEEIIESIKNLEKLGIQISSSNLTDSNQALSLAQGISEIPLIYYPFGLQAAAIRFKNSLQENTKNHAIVEDVIEFCHNGIVSWEKESNVNPILIIGKDDHIKTKERLEIIKNYFKQKNIQYIEIFSINGTILSKLISLIYLLDYLTIYKSILDKTDPSPVDSIDFIKTRLE